ncbi:MAG TPA: MBL fold metallo-hydrolase [Sphingomonas sp.]|nr:MBL fold metallo-hydrolase [Sphingomonas sp.]
MDSGAARLAQAPGFYRFRLGDFDIVPLHDGVLSFDRPPGFVRNATDEQVGGAYAAAGMPRDKVTITFTPLAVRTPEGIVLIDSGLGQSGPPGTGALMRNLSAAGLRPEDVSTVIISHFHGDHIGGLVGKDGSLAFPNAELAVPAQEWAYWMDEGNMSRAPEGLQANFAQARGVFGAHSGRVRQFGWGEQMVPGFTAVDANGHTPGMSALLIASGREQMMFVADITNNPLVFARNPDWQVVFDMDPVAATATRRRLLDRAAADNLRLSFFHAPFPATGYIAKSGTGYEYLPALWAAS